MGKPDRNQEPKETGEADKADEPKPATPKQPGQTFSQRGVEVKK